MQKEIWKKIPSLPTVFASGLGRLQVDPTIAKNRKYKTIPTLGVWNKTVKRYQLVHRGKTYRAARLICEAFHGAPPAGKNVCMHIDENARNNRPDNLKWTTQKENLNCPKFLEYCRGRTGENSPTIKARKKRL